ncbi:invasion associated locus B family protein [Saliniramus sp.]|uniref:invasion associated locus B family protein n=1 Tax=Saliniramus sp. TaxID=2986772 RepID=UPI002CB938E8|nr:invasion associated locus B family protein [Saliniramus sp.]HMB10859.1 invasion associated locus B family protein [Saliniramus sp.]
MKAYALFLRRVEAGPGIARAPADDGAARAIARCAAIRIALALPLFGLVFALACTPDPAQASVETRRFDDWELVCRTAEAQDASADADEASQAQGASQDCRISQRLAVAESGQTVFLLTGLPGDAPGSYVAIVSVPLRGYLAPGIELRVDERPPVGILYETCDPSGCHAGFPLEGKILQAFRAGLTARFRIWTARDEPVDLDVSLIGFTAAFQALRERSS